MNWKVQIYPAKAPRLHAVRLGTVLVGVIKQQVISRNFGRITSLAGWHFERSNTEKNRYRRDYDYEMERERSIRHAVKDYIALLNVTERLTK